MKKLNIKKELVSDIKLSTGNKKYRRTQVWTDGTTNSYTYYRDNVRYPDETLWKDENNKTKNIQSSNKRAYHKACKDIIALHQIKQTVPEQDNRLEEMYNMTLKQLAYEWMQDQDEQNLISSNTYARRSSTLTNHIIPKEFGLGDMKIRDITSYQIRQFYKEKDFKTQKTAHMTLNPLFDYAVREEILRDSDGNPAPNPIPKAVLQQFKRGDRRKEIEAGMNTKPVFELDEMVQFFENLDLYSPKHLFSPFMDVAVVYHLIALCGMRPSEALSRKWEDINYIDKTIAITDQIQGISKTLRKGTIWESDSYAMPNAPLKTRKASRLVPLPDRTLQRLMLVPEEERQGYLILNKDRRPMTLDNFRTKHHYKLTSRLGVKYGLHDLRKFFGSYQISWQNVDPFTVADWMGHDDIKVTYRDYRVEIKKSKIAPRKEIRDWFAPKQKLSELMAYENAVRSEIADERPNLFRDGKQITYRR